MKRRMMIYAGMLMGALFSTQGIALTTATAPPVTTPEPATMGELGAGLTGLVGYFWWRVSRKKRQGS